MQEGVDPRINNRFGVNDCRLARFHTIFDNLRQIVDRIKKDIVEFADFDLHVTRHRQIDHEHRPVTTRLDRPFDQPQTENRQLAGRTGDHDVEFGQPSRQVFQTDSLRAKTVGQCPPPVDGAVGDDDLLGLLRGKVRRAQLDHFARADEQHTLIGNAFEDAPGQAHGASSNASGSASGESAAPATSGPSAPATALSAADRRLIAATQGGLPLVPRPYDAVGQPLGESGAQVRARLRDMQARGLLRRIAAVPNHYALGYVANGMTVWDVDDAQVDALGERMGAYPGVSHCYRRPRRLPVWRYNLFAMLHGHSRAEVEAQALALAALLGPACRAHDILYSSAILKKTGLRLRAAG